jgi:aminoglycoside phosphotransferase family enzyme/predicted kinase
MGQPARASAYAGASLEARLLAFLGDPDSYSPRPDDVQLIHTHISHVALAGAYVYKVARVVKFGFVDFTTLEKRRRCAERAIDLNRRLSPDVYLDVVPIVQDGHRLRFANAEAPEADVVEYAVRMRRLSEEGFLDRRLREGRVTAPDWERLIQALTAFYRNQPPVGSGAGEGHQAALQTNLAGNLEPVEDLVRAGISRTTVTALAHYNAAFLKEAAGVLEQRVRRGWVRDGHGDLRPEHIHISDDRIRIFDCVEFNDELRQIDVAADIAFLAMELDFTGHAVRARRIAAAIGADLQDTGQSQVLDFYKCYRACVRGRVSLLSAAGAQRPANVAQQQRVTAGHYYRLALNYAVHGSAPALFLVMGRIATGKTTQAQALAAELGCEVHHSDNVRKRLGDLPAAERPSEEARRRLYAPEMTERTYAALLLLAERRLREGASVILDATFSRRRHRAMAQALARTLGCDACFIQLTAPERLVLERLGRRDSQAGVVSDARREDFARLAGAYEPPVEIAPDNLVDIDSTTDEGGVFEATLRALAARNIRRCLTRTA